MVRKFFFRYHEFVLFYLLENDNNHHLCEIKPSLLNDGPPLNDFNQTLTVNGLSNGVQLIMQSGSVPSRNHVRLRIFKIINKSYKPIKASKTNLKSNIQTSKIGEREKRKEKKRNIFIRNFLFIK